MTRIMLIVACQLLALAGVLGARFHFLNELSDSSETLSFELFTDSPDNRTYVAQLWSKVVTSDMIDKAKNTTFIRGIADGTLNPELYGVYGLQDAVYLKKALENFNKVQNSPSNTDASAQYFGDKVKSYLSYARAALEQWNINPDVPESIRLNKAAMSYISFQAYVAQEYFDEPWYYGLVNYPCYRLWPDMASYLNTAVDPFAPNPYRSWITANLGYRSPNKLAAMLEEFKDKFDETLALKILKKGFFYEVEFWDNP